MIASRCETPDADIEGMNTLDAIEAEVARCKRADDELARLVRRLREALGDEEEDPVTLLGSFLEVETRG